MARNDRQARVRLPADVVAFVMEEAHDSASSQNSVIVRAIRAAMKTKSPATAATVPGSDHDQSPDKE